MDLVYILVGALLLAIGFYIGSYFFPHHQDGHQLPEGWYYSTSRTERWDDDDIDKLYPHGSEWREADLAGKDN